VRRTVPPSVEIEEQIDRLLAVGVGESRRDALSELAKLGARLIIQRAVEEEFDAWLGRARYERRPEAPPGLRNGFRPRRLQTAEGELAVETRRDRAFANARTMRRLFDDAIAHQAQRLGRRGGDLTREELMTLEAEDLAGAAPDQRGEDPRPFVQGPSSRTGFRPIQPLELIKANPS
jgi:transposase-like protein